jgi:multisubunit Na+/H+ antiporter MnhE subunit
VLVWLAVLASGALAFFALGVITAFWAGHVLHRADESKRRTIRESRAAHGRRGSRQK